MEGSSAQQDHKQKLYEVYQKRVHELEWNNEEEVCLCYVIGWLLTWLLDVLLVFRFFLMSQIVIVPAVHGTEYNIAMAICSTGFAALSSMYVGSVGIGY